MTIDADPMPKPVPADVMPFGAMRISTGGSVFIVRPEDVAVEVGAWCASQYARFSATLLGAFESVMHSEGMHAAKPADFEKAFSAFTHREG